MDIKKQLVLLTLTIGSVVALVDSAFSLCQSGISLTEQASVKAVPDEANIVLSVENQESDIDVALQKNTDEVAKLRNYLKKEGLLSLATDPPIVENRYTQAYSNGVTSQNLSGYLIRTTVTGLLKDISKVKVVTAGAISHGATAVVGTQLRTSQYDQLHDQARREAVKKARARAVELAQQLGQPAGIVTDVVEVGAYPPWSTFNSLSTVQTQGFMRPSLANFSAYGMGMPYDVAIEGNKIVILSNISLCMEFKDLAAREKR